MLDPAALKELIQKRRSIFPATYNDTPIPKEIIDEVLESANWAPTHKKTEPWRFKVLRGAALERLSVFLSERYKATTPADKFSAKKYEKLGKNPKKADTIIAICMQREPEESLPEWEELAAVAMAVQNMYLTCTAHHIGCFWSSPKVALEADEFLGLQDGEKCWGLFYMANHNMPEIPGERGPIEDKVEWIEA